jgi:hypothetical protein
MSRAKEPVPDGELGGEIDIDDFHGVVPAMHFRPVDQALQEA